MWFPIEKKHVISNQFWSSKCRRCFFTSESAASKTSHKFCLSQEVNNPAGVGIQEGIYLPKTTISPAQLPPKRRIVSQTPLFRCELLGLERVNSRLAPISLHLHYVSELKRKLMRYSNMFFAYIATNPTWVGNLQASNKKTSILKWSHLNLVAYYGISR